LASGHATLDEAQAAGEAAKCRAPTLERR
jgi:hypothetical protein